MHLLPLRTHSLPHARQARALMSHTDMSSMAHTRVHSGCGALHGLDRCAVTPVASYRVVSLPKHPRCTLTVQSGYSARCPPRSSLPSSVTEGALGRPLGNEGCVSQNPPLPRSREGGSAVPRGSDWCATYPAMGLQGEPSAPAAHGWWQAVVELS